MDFWPAGCTLETAGAQTVQKRGSIGGYFGNTDSNKMIFQTGGSRGVEIRLYSFARDILYLHNLSLF